jgi:predicted alpha/beta superfamily hydrolase
VTRYFVALPITICAFIGPTLSASGGAKKDTAPLVIGETFTIDSKILGESRRINVYFPPGYTKAPNARFPVLYMPDGGLAEDFLHVAGLVQVLAGNGTMRPFLLVGIENTQRRRDLTGPTENANDKKIAPHVGGAKAFRSFIRQELMPQVKARYRTSKETAIVGESLAGLFVVETFLLEPDLFDTYMAFDPSLWWNNQKLVNDAAEHLRTWPKLDRTLYFASSDEKDLGKITRKLATILARDAPASIHWHYEKMPEERHATIFHPGALKAFRAVLKPRPDKNPKKDPSLQEQPAALLKVGEPAPTLKVTKWLQGEAVRKFEPGISMSSNSGPPHAARWFQAWLEKDIATVGWLTAGDYLYVAPSGLVLDRPAILPVIRSPSHRLNLAIRGLEALSVSIVRWEQGTPRKFEPTQPLQPTGDAMIGFR